MAMYDGNSATGVQPDYSIQVPISDSQGGQHTVQLDLLKSTTPEPVVRRTGRRSRPSDVVTGSGLANGQIATGIIAFTPTGQIDPTKTTSVQRRPTPPSPSAPPTPRRRAPAR